MLFWECFEPLGDQLCFAVKLMYFLSLKRHAYEVMNCAFISFLPHPVNNAPVIEIMRRNQQGEPVFKSTQNGWVNMWFKILTELKFKQSIDMGNQKQNFIGYKGYSKHGDILLCKIEDLQDPTIPCQSWIQDSQDPTKCFLPEIQEPHDPTVILSW